MMQALTESKRPRENQVIPILCLVQEGHIAPSVGEDLRSSLNQLAQDHLGSAAGINWVEVQAGSGFTEAKPSTSTLVSIQSDRALTQDERISIMQKICDFWMEKTDCSINEIVASVNDPAASQG